MRVAPSLALLVAGVGVSVGCRTNEATPPAKITAPEAGASASAADAAAAPTTVGAMADAAPASKGIGAEGGTIEGDAARIVIAEGALAGAQRITVKRVAQADLASWPRGTALGFVFEPPELRFRIPARLELPHDDPSGEVMCETADGERRTERFDTKPGPKPFKLHVVELPRRCAVYSLEHMKARKASEEKTSEVLSKQNKSFKWESKGKVCDPHELARPNAGKDLREPPGLEGCPAGMAKVPGKAVCVDRWEAHVVELLDDGTERTWSPFFNPGGVRVRAKSAPGAIPQGYISALQAGEACKEAQKRLCKDDEWIAACRGKSSTQFPYGKDEKRGTCNDSRPSHPAMQYLESRDLSVFTKLEHPCINQIADSLLAAGAKTDCKTPEGAFDMVGNLHEWTADPDGTFRGGYYVDTWLNGHGCDYVTTRHEARYWDYSTGFRCCADAPK